MEPSKRTLSAEDTPLLTKLLGNHVVGSRILSQLDVGSLQGLRQTCTTWNHAIVPQLHNKHEPVSFDDDDDDSDDEDADDDFKPKRKLPVFIQLMRTSSAIPFAKYELDICSFEDEGQTIGFLAVCGNVIKKLTLLPSRPKFDENGRKSKLKTIELGFLYKIMQEHTPNLQDLCLSILPTAIQLPTSPAGVFDATSFAEIPPLRLGCLHLDFDMNFFFANATDADKKSEQDSIYQILRALFGRLVQLETLTTNIGVPRTRLNLPTLSAIQDSKLRLNKLRTLRLSCLSAAEIQMLIDLAMDAINSGSSINPNCLRLNSFGTSHFVSQGFSLSDMAPHLTRFLRTQSACLRSLELVFDGSEYAGGADRNLFQPRPLLESDASLAVVIPALPQLRSLALTTFFIDPLPVQFEGGRLNLALPRLQRLQIHFDYNTWLMVLHRGAECLSKIHELAHRGLRELELRRVSLDPSLFFWGLLYHGVTNLTLHHWVRRRDDLTLIWTTWPALEKLHIGLRPTEGHSFNLDQFVTGIPSADFNQIETELVAGRMPPSLKRLRRLASQYKTSPGISDCQFLRSFTLETTSSNSVLTDLGGYLGLALASPTLQHITIQRIKYYSDRMCRLLRGNTKHSAISKDCESVVSGALGPTAVLEFGLSRWSTWEDKSDIHVSSVTI